MSIAINANIINFVIVNLIIVHLVNSLFSFYFIPYFHLFKKNIFNVEYLVYILIFCYLLSIDRQRNLKNFSYCNLVKCLNCILIDLIYFLLKLIFVLYSRYELRIICQNYLIFDQNHLENQKLNSLFYNLIHIYFIEMLILSNLIQE